MGIPTKFALVGVVTIVALTGCGSSGNTATIAPSATQSAVSQSLSSSGPTEVKYADASSTQTIDLYLPSGVDGPTPVVVLIHGGAFQMGDSSMEAGYAQALVDNGFAVAAVNYRLSGEAAYPAGAQDVKAAVRYLRANAAEYNINPDRVAAWGQSAGGYLANLLGATGDQQTIFDDSSLGNADQSSAVQAVVSWFGPSDFATMDEQAAEVAACAGRAQSHGTADSPESAWLGEAVATSEKTESTDLSGYVATASTLPAWYLAHGDSDCLVPAGQSAELQAALEDAGGDSTYVVLEGAGHMDQAFDSTQLQPTIDFLKSTFNMS